MRVDCDVCKNPIRETGTALNGKPVHIYCYHQAKDAAPTLEEMDFVMKQVQYGYDSHADWEDYFRHHAKFVHALHDESCEVCKQVTFLGDADFHAEQKKRYEIELRVLRWAKANL